MRGSTRRFGLVSTLVMLSTLMSAPVARANNWGSSVGTGGTSAHVCDTTVYSMCVADNQYHLIWIQSADEDLNEEI